MDFMTKLGLSEMCVTDWSQGALRVFYLLSTGLSPSFADKTVTTGTL